MEAEVEIQQTGGNRAREGRTRARKLRLFVAVLIALGTIGLGANAVSATDVQVPFRASYSGRADFTSETSVLFQGTGIATDLGASTNEGHILITGPDSSCPGGLANINTATRTAANGDVLTLTASDVSCPIGQLVFQGTGHWVVTGGTGRFSGATGQGTIDGGADFNQHQFHIELTGTISVPNGR
jgi:hypothetical protein